MNRKAYDGEASAVAWAMRIDSVIAGSRSAAAVLFLSSTRGGGPRRKRIPRLK